MTEPVEHCFVNLVSGALSIRPKTQIFLSCTCASEARLQVLARARYKPARRCPLDQVSGEYREAITKAVI